MASQKLKGTKFQIMWTTDVPADSVVMFTCCTFSNSTSSYQPQDAVHRLRRRQLRVPVKSTDANGHSSTAGPFHHQNRRRFTSSTPSPVANAGAEAPVYIALIPIVAV